jgi:DNA-binding CsgD family transcriptional regulator
VSAVPRRTDAEEDRRGDRDRRQHRHLRAQTQRHRTTLQGALYPKQEAEAVRRYVAGEATDEIATALGISPSGIYPILGRNGFDPTRKPPRFEWNDTEAARVIRGLPAYRRWRVAVLRREGRACQECGARSSFANPPHVHHLRSFAEILAEYLPISVEQTEGYDALRDVDNGVTLCARCHRSAHAGVSLN